ncbi:MAG: DNA-binding protein WhiA [Ruminococcaceae bacterium]|nr:DNA-binding protein WhiA [Oscillospiraceae bacterium]
MSFSAEAKAELCRAPLSRRCCAAAEAYGVLLYANTFSPQEIRIITGCVEFAQRLPKLFKKAFGFGFDSVAETNGRGKSVFQITDKARISAVFERYGYEAESLLAHHVNLSILEEDCCRAAFVRGAFLAGGSITDPEKRYHLELVTDHKSVSGETFALLLELGFAPKDTVRASRYVTYFKQSEAIEDFLTTLGAPSAAMEIMSAKVEKDMRNAINRRVNCDSANADKIVSAAQAQLDRIRLLEREVGLENLPEELEKLAFLRVANPAASISDLAILSDPPTTKSCINHRLRKLMSYPIN